MCVCVDRIDMYMCVYVRVCVYMCVDGIDMYVSMCVYVRD